MRRRCLQLVLAMLATGLSSRVWGQAATVLLGSGKSVLSLSFSLPGGRYLLSDQNDKVVIWDMTVHRPINVLPVNTGQAIRVFDDGRVATFTGGALVWTRLDDPSETKTVALLASIEGTCRSELSPTARWVALLGCNGQLTILDTELRELVPVVLDFNPVKLHWSDDIVVVEDRSENQAVFDAPARRLLDLTEATQGGGHLLDVRRVGDAIRAIVGFGPRYRGAAIFDLTNRLSLGKVDTLPAVAANGDATFTALAIAVRENGDYVVQRWSGGQGGGKIDAGTGLTTLAISPQGTSAALGHSTGQVSFVDFTSSNTIVPPALNSDPIATLALMDATTFVTANDSGQVDFVTADAAPTIRSLRVPCLGRFNVSAGARYSVLACAYPDPLIRILPTDGRRPSASRSIAIPRGRREILDGVSDVAVSYGGDHAAWVQNELSTKSAKVEGFDEPLCNSKVFAHVLFSSDGKYLAAGCVQGGLRVFDTQTNTLVASVNDSAVPLAFVSRGHSLICGDANGLDVRDTETLQVTSTVQWDPFPRYAAISSRDNRLAVSTGTSRVGVFSATQNGVAHLADFDAGPAAVTALSFSLTSVLLVGGQDGIIQLWSSDNQLLLRMYFDHAGRWLALSPDGTFEGSAEAINWFAFRVPETSLAVGADVLFNDYYSPGLLQRAWIELDSSVKRASSAATAAQVAGWQLLKEHAAARIVHEGNATAVCLAFAPRGLKVYADGSPFAWDAGAIRHDPDDPTCAYRISLPPGQQIDLESEVPISKPQIPRHALPDLPTKPRHTYIAVVGVGAYDFQRSGFDSIPSAAKGAQLVYDSFKAFAARQSDRDHFRVSTPIDRCGRHQREHLGEPPNADFNGERIGCRCSLPRRARLGTCGPGPFLFRSIRWTRR